MNSFLHILCLTATINHLIPIVVGWPIEERRELCGTLFSETNFTGHNLNIWRAEFQSDLSYHFINEFPPIPFQTRAHEFQNWNKLTRSIQIQVGCTITAWSEPYSNGEKVLLKNDHQTLETNWDNTISSLSCLCSTDCERNKCPWVKLKRNECAMGFLEDHCNTCNGVYLNINPISKTFIDLSEGSKIKSIVVKQKCQLITYDMQNFEGNQTTFTSGIHNNFDNNIASYNCTCVNKYSEPELKEKISSGSQIGAPIMLDISGDTHKILRRARTFPNSHPGLIAALQSTLNGKSSKNAYILLLGLTGSGKSSTINFLLNNLINPPPKGKYYMTSEIQEFHIPVPLDNLGIKNSELRIIDTPGFFSARGFEEDSRLLATLDAYLNNHEELRNKTSNIVMIFSNFNHNRLIGLGPGFVNMLRGLNSFTTKIITKKYSNVILVLSRFMGSIKSLQKNPSVRLNEFKRAIEDFSLLPKPVAVVVAENKPDLVGLQMTNGHYKLPSGDSYPNNVFNKILQATTNGGDPIGSEIFKTAFRNPEVLKVSKFKRYPIISLEYSKKYLNDLSRLYAKDITETEISILLDTTYKNFKEQLSFPPDHTLIYLQRFLNLRNIFTINDLPKTNSDKLNFFKELKKSSGVIELFQKTFPNLQIPILEPPVFVGNGYDIIKDDFLTNSPFRINSFEISEIGYLIPDYVLCRIHNTVTNRHERFNTFEEYYLARLTSLSVSTSYFGNISNIQSRAQVRAAPLPGHIILYPEQREMTVVSEFRLFELLLKIDNTSLNIEFVKRVNSMPGFNVKDYKSVQSWKQFFSDYGTHIVNSVYGGGEIEIHSNLNDSLLSTHFNLDKVAQIMFKTLKLNEFNGSSSSSNISIKNILKFRGGAFKYHTSCLNQFDLPVAIKLLEDWKESLSLQPAMLKSTIKLVSISEIAKHISPAAHLKISEAEAFLFNPGVNELTATSEPGVNFDNICL